MRSHTVENVCGLRQNEIINPEFPDVNRFLPFIENSPYDIIRISIDFDNTSPQSKRVTIFDFLVGNLY